MTHTIIAALPFEFRYLVGTKLKPSGRMLMAEHKYICDNITGKRTMIAVEQWNPFSPQIRFILN